MTALRGFHFSYVIHPRLDCSKGVFSSLSANAHTLGRVIETLLHAIENILVFSAADAKVITGGASLLEFAARTMRTPVAEYPVLGSHNIAEPV